MYRCRCNRKACQRRRSLRMHPDDYLRRPRCACRKGHLRIDPYRNSGRETAGRVCRCSGYWFPHRTGSLWCMEGKWTAEQMQARMGQD